MLKKYSQVSLLLTLLMSVSLLFGACGDITATPAANSQTSTKLASLSVPTGVTSQLATAFPGDTQIYLTLNTNSSSDQVAAWQKIVAYLDNIPQVKQVFDNVDVAKALGVGNYATDVKPWIGSEAALGIIDTKSLVGLVGSMSASMGNAKPGSTATPSTTPSTNSSSTLAAITDLEKTPLLLGATVTNRTAADAFAQKFLAKFAMGATPTSSTYNGATLYQLTGFVPLTVGLNDKEILLSTNADIVKAALDRTAGQGLDGSNSFKQIETNLPTANLGFVYLNSQSVISTVLGDANVQKMLSQAGNSNLVANYQYYDSTGLSFSTTSNGFLVDSYSTLLQDKEPANVKSMLSRQPNVSTILNVLPASTFAFANEQKLSDSYNNIISTLNSMGTQGTKITDEIKQFEQNSGLSINNDILPLFQGESAFFVNTQSQVDHPKDLPVGLGIVSEASDANAASASITKIVAAIQKASNGKLTFQSKTTDGVTYQTAGVPNTSSTYLSLGVAGKYVFLSVDNQAAAPVITSATGGANFNSSSSAILFKTTQGSLVGDNQGYFFVDLQQAFGLVNALPANDQTQVKPYLDKLTQLKAVAAASQVSPTATHSTLFIYFPVTQ